MFLLYPQTCCHCYHNILKKNNFCSVCQSDFTLLDPEQHCPYCFCENRGICNECINYKRFRIKMGAVCNHIGAVKSHLNFVRKGMQTKIASSLLSVQFFRLKWEIPDCIIPIPSRGNNEFIKVFSRSIGVPYYPILKEARRCLPQMRIPWKERYQLEQGKFQLKTSVAGKNILLVDDLLGTGTTLRVAAEVLKEANRIYALTISKLCFL